MHAPVLSLRHGCLPSKIFIPFFSSFPHPVLLSYSGCVIAGPMCLLWAEVGPQNNENHQVLKTGPFPGLPPGSDPTLSAQ